MWYNSRQRKETKSPNNRRQIYLPSTKTKGVTTIKVTISDAAEKAINRFKNLSIWNVEDAAERLVEHAEAFCEEAMRSVSFEKYDEENNITLFCSSEDGSELIVNGVRRGNLTGAFWLPTKAPTARISAK